MARTLELKPIDNKKSFYGKAIAIIEENGEILCKSYDTVVCKIADGKLVRLWDGYSATTMRHINAFLHTFGIAGGGKSWWDALEVIR